ncbi:hypothetical protein GCM10010343_34450 [Streptomyces avidinii]|uniref:Alkanesulfonate monooxygenase SsuD/methylene tetrahydromethanopterin reductase-like flavin-dependent oxidoreductase (Luciferase family) n=1 Tax=Streptomyces avidinii TaxID=1895 RepID=A0ABS4LFR6_STRAV|nr:alkanesulfonate monooxygenase SsuD/methylene tetrahydromethanopterin reductase-like flavin-dependent oxidoreductase (luciferase family) [Streptomyces avidinii]GGZ05772.1 hypothetical protein GCM10010343_34450 [Streptomyces avidinii]
MSSSPPAPAFTIASGSSDPLHLAVALGGAGRHPAAWREPGARPGGLFTARYWADAVSEAEAALPWVRSIRTAEGAIAFPTPAEARALPWTDADRKLVADRVETQFVGSPRTVADHLDRLQEATGADELLITTITHDHTDRVRSYRLLAEEWQRRSG